MTSPSTQPQDAIDIRGNPTDYDSDTEGNATDYDSDTDNVVAVAGSDADESENKVQEEMFGVCVGQEWSDEDD